MRERIVKRYYCDYCKKAGCSKYHMTEHEKHCTMNPNRDCRMCALLANSAAPLDEIRALVPRIREVSDDQGLYDHTHYGRKVAEAVDVMRQAADGCPVCVFAALRQEHVFVSSEAFDFKAECDAVFREVNADRYQGVAL